MGPGGHFCRCKRRSAIANTYGYTATDANTQAGAIGKAAPNASTQAIEFRRAYFWWCRRCDVLRLASNCVHSFRLNSSEDGFAVRASK
jgi:hypothetical protein